MKLVIFGLTISSSWGNGHATLLRGLFKALTAHGHHIVFFERDVPYYSQHRDLIDIPRLKLHLYDRWKNVEPAAKAELSDADVGVVTSFCPDGVDATELVLSSSSLSVFYDLDTPVTLESIDRGEPVSYIGNRGLSDFDLVLSYTGGRALVELQTKLGAKRVAPLYGSVDPEVHRPTTPCQNFASDFSYLGTYAEDRQKHLESFFINAAGKLPKHKFIIGGSKYPANFPWQKNTWYVQHVAPHRHSAFYCSSPLTLNVTRGAMSRFGYCPSGRLFEAAACGTTMISDYWEGLDEFFQPDNELLIANDTEDVVDFLSLSSAELKRIGEAGRERALTSHTAQQRAIELEQILSL
jgi:spore maturation protein CgeB